MSQEEPFQAGQEGEIGPEPLGMCRSPAYRIEKVGPR